MLAHQSKTKMNENIITFNKDAAWSKAKRDKYLTKFYETYSVKYVFLDGSIARDSACDRIQRRCHVDTVMVTRQGRTVFVEEKIVRWKGRNYDHFTLEIDSCTSPFRHHYGCLEDGQADWLLYCFEQDDESLVAYMMSFQPLKLWVQHNINRFKLDIQPTPQATRCALVPVAEAVRAVQSYKFLIDTDAVRRVEI